jgi:hypothetical protein
VLGCPLRIFKHLGLQGEKVLVCPSLTVDLPAENILRGLFRTHVGLIKRLIELFELSFSHTVAYKLLFYLSVVIQPILKDLIGRFVLSRCHKLKPSVELISLCFPLLLQTGNLVLMSAQVGDRH